MVKIYRVSEEVIGSAEKRKKMNGDNRSGLDKLKSWVGGKKRLLKENSLFK